MGNHKTALSIDLEPTFFTKKTKHASDRDARGAEGTGKFLVRETHIEFQTVFTGLAVSCANSSRNPRKRSSTR